MAVAAARLAGIEKMSSPAIANLPGVPHRLNTSVPRSKRLINEKPLINDAAQVGKFVNSPSYSDCWR